jgi:hypothetical protein
MNAQKISTDQIAMTRAAEIIDLLKARCVPISLIWDVDAAVVEAHVPSDQAARMLGPRRCGAWRL